MRSGAILLALGAFVFGSAPAAATITADPPALYATMRRAYDRGLAGDWSYGASIAYFSAVLDAGRAYALFRPTDAQYAEVAGLTVEMATQLHYDPLTSNDAALWYVREAAGWVQAHGDSIASAKASALLTRLDAGRDLAVVAQQAEEDAAANVRFFHGAPDALVAQVVADARAYAVTRNSVYRTALLQHAAAPAVPYSLIPAAERRQLFSIVSATLADKTAGETDRANARAIVARRNLTSAARLASDPSGESRSLALTHTAPADEYFGEIRISPVGIQDEMERIGKYLDSGWGERMAPDALHLATAIEDWQHQYPHDRTLPKYLAELYALLTRVGAPSTTTEAQHVRDVLVVQYAASNEAHALDAS